MDGSKPIESCPSHQTLSAILHLPENDNLVVETRSHLNHCKNCQAKLDQLTDSPELVQYRQTAKAISNQIASPSDEMIANVARRVASSIKDESILLNAQQDTDTNAAITEIGTDVSPPKTESTGKLPKTIGHYSILRELGRGGSGVVYLAFDPKINRKIAIKRIIGVHAGQNKRLIREAKAAAALQLDEVVRIYSIEADEDDTPFITMEYVPGISLSEKIKQHRSLRIEQAVDICESVAKAVQAAHRIGILHRDIKPSNILLGPNDNPKLADFGLADLGDSYPQLTRTGVLMGTPSYMSPEQASGHELDFRSDIYSLGCVLYESLTGAMPFYGTAHQVLRQIEENDPIAIQKLNENVPSDLAVICQKAMSKMPENRYRSTEDFRNDLLAWRNGGPILARPESSLQKAARWYRNNKKVSLLSAAIAALLIATTIGSLIATQKIANERSKAVRSADKAEKMATQALEQRTLAIDTINQLIFDIQNELREKPGTIEVRNSILKNALQGLQRVVNEQTDDEFGLNHSTTTAFLRMGDIEISRGNDELAKKHFQKAQELATKQCKQCPDDEQNLINLATAKLGVADIENINYGFKEALEQFKEIAELRKKIVELNPNVENQIDYARILGRISSSYSATGQLQKAVQTSTTLLKIYESFPEEVAASNNLTRSHSVAMATMATQLIFMHRIEEAEDYMKRVRSLNQKLLANDEHNRAYLLDAAVALSQFTQIYSQRGDWESASQYAAEARKMHQRIVNANPENLWSRSNLGLMWSAEAMTLLAKNNIEAARQAWQKNIEIQLSVLEKNANNPRMVFPAIESHIAIAGTYVRSAEFDTALEYCESACELLNSLPTEQLTANSAIQDAVLVTRSIKDALQLAQTTDLSTPEQIETLTGDTEKWAFALHAYRESLHSNIVIATQLADLLANVQMQNARVHSAMNFTLAATYVMVATKRHDADPEVDNSSVFKKSIDLLSHHLPPQEVFQAVLRDPDFELLRQSDEFKNVVESIETRK